MNESFTNKAGRIIVDNLIRTIHENRAYLSEIDGAIGDGDHGINMDKGFSLAEKEIAGKEMTMSEAFRTLGRTLVMEIGGSMGPLYGAYFKGMAKASKDDEFVSKETFRRMLDEAYEGVIQLGNAKIGDKTLVDTLEPALRAYYSACEGGKPFVEALDAMMEAAEQGMEGTKDLVAKIGRAARLGERSRGVQDAGATSCFLLLLSMGRTMKKLLAVNQTK